jgi:phage protein D
LSGIITGVTVRWWDEINREAIIGEAGVNDETPVGTGDTAGKIAQGIYGDIEKTITDEPVDSQDEAKNIAISTLGDVNKEFVTGKGKTIGIPELIPGVMIEIKGIGDRFSGKYYVSSTTHTINSSGYLTSFNVRRNTK